MNGKASVNGRVSMDGRASMNWKTSTKWLLRSLALKILIAIVITVLIASPAAASSPAATSSPVTASASIAISTLAQSDEPPQVPTLIEALQLLGTTVGAGMVISFLLTRVEWFKALTGERRFWIVLGLSMAIPFMATLIINLVPAETLVALEPYWQALSAGFIVFIGSQAQYALSKVQKPDAVFIEQAPTADQS